jgi:hypothetical protein
MKAIRPALGIHVRAALFVAAMLSTSVAAAELSPNSAEWPSGDGWIIQLGPQGLPHAAHDWEIPDSPLLPDAVTPKTMISVPTEFKFDITLTIRHNDKSLENHGARFRHPIGRAHCCDVARGATRVRCAWHHDHAARHEQLCRPSTVASAWSHRGVASGDRSAAVDSWRGHAAAAGRRTGARLRRSSDPGLEGPALRGSAP